MKRKYLSKKMKLLIGASTATLAVVPLIAVSAVACSKEKSTIKPAITISTQPKNQTIYLNQNENLPILSVEAKADDSNSQLTYQWYENDTNSTTNGKIINGATKAKHTIPISDTQKTGTKYFYTIIKVVKDNNILNSIISDIATITITDKIPPITISSQPTNQIAIINQTENMPTFSVSVNDIKGAKFSYEWYINTTLISGANSSSYTVPVSDVTIVGRRIYHVQISGMLNGIKLTPVISNAVNLTVRPKPRVKITSNPVNQVAYVNQTENFPIFDVAVAPIDNVKFTYQWYSNTNNSNADGTLIQGATKSSYQVMTKDVGSSAATKYFYVVVSGTINGVTLTPLNSSAVSLVIKAKPTVAIKTQPQNLIVHTNQNAAFPTFSVVAEPIESAAFTYQWYSNSSNSTTGGVAIKGATNANYQTSASDIGGSVGSIKYFYVQISGSVGGIKLNTVNSDVVSLTTQAASAITISTQPTAEQVAAKDASLTLTTVATTTSSSKLSYQWQKSNKLLTNPVWTNIAGANSSTYTFNAANEPGTITYYRVIVSEAITNATATSREAKVSVGYANVAAAMPVLNAWLASKDNQRNLLNSYFTKGNVNPLSILTSPTNTSLGSAVWTYNFNNLPTATLNSITFAEATTDNTLPADTWEIKATTTTVGSYQIWNETNNQWGANVSIPVGTVFTFYLTFSFKENVTVTTTANPSLVTNITRTINLTNGSSTLSFAIDNKIPWNKIKSSFTPPGASATTINFSFSNPGFYEFTNINSDLPVYPILSNSSSR